MILKFFYLLSICLLSFSMFSIAQKNYIDESGTLRILKTDIAEKKNFSKQEYSETQLISNNINYEIISSNNYTWGYNIYSDKKLIIHQPTIPGIQIKQGYKTKGQAKRVALAVIKKIKNGELNPAIISGEIDSLNLFQ